MFYGIRLFQDFGSNFSFPPEAGSVIYRVFSLVFKPQYLENCTCSDLLGFII